jgi:uncharacterized membrane protein
MKKLKTSIGLLLTLALLLPIKTFAAANLFQQLASEFQTAFTYLKIIIGLSAAVLVAKNGLALYSKMGDKNHQGDIAKDILYFSIGLVILYFVLTNYTSYAS